MSARDAGAARRRRTFSAAIRWSQWIVVGASVLGSADEINCGARGADPRAHFTADVTPIRCPRTCSTAICAVASCIATRSGRSFRYVLPAPPAPLRTRTCSSARPVNAPRVAGTVGSSKCPYTIFSASVSGFFAHFRTCSPAQRCQRASKAIVDSRARRRRATPLSDSSRRARRHRGSSSTPAGPAPTAERKKQSCAAQKDSAAAVKEAGKRNIARDSDTTLARAHHMPLQAAHTIVRAARATRPRHERRATPATTAGPRARTGSPWAQPAPATHPPTRYHTKIYTRAHVKVGPTDAANAPTRRDPSIRTARRARVASISSGRNVWNVPGWCAKFVCSRTCIRSITVPCICDSVHVAGYALPIARFLVNIVYLTRRDMAGGGGSRDESCQTDSRSFGV